MLQLRVEATASAPHAGLVSAFRGRGRLLAGARVPPEPSRRGLLVCYMLARRARRERWPRLSSSSKRARTPLYVRIPAA